MDYPNFGNVPFAADSTKVVFVHVVQMSVRRDKHGDSGQRSFRDNQTVIQFLDGEQFQFVQALGELLGDAVADRTRSKGVISQARRFWSAAMASCFSSPVLKSAA